MSALGHRLVWRDDEIGQAALALPGSDTEIVLSTRQQYAPNRLVESADEAARRVEASKGRYVTDESGKVTGVAVDAPARDER